MSGPLFPTALEQRGKDELFIRWNDGHESQYPVRHLRLNCPCAVCVDEWTREKRLKDETVPMDVRPTRIEPVGRYAFRIDWTDRHGTGIYPFDQLRKLCHCSQCAKA